MADPGFRDLLAFVIERTGLAWYAKEGGTLALHVAQRMAGNSDQACRAYLERLRDSPPEMDALVALLTVGETYFFRHTEAFAALREVVLPELLERNRERRSLRIWSAGCANGAEPYSLAILLQSEFGSALRDWSVAIIGTDINRQALTQAQVGRFGAWALRAVAPDVAATCFFRAGELWEIRPQFRQWVSFRHGNLAVAPEASSPDPCGQDLVLCRNVMIYFDAETIRRTLERLHRGMAQDGWLLIGPSEHAGDGIGRFQPVARPGVTLYRRSGPLGENHAAGTADGWQDVRPLVTLDLDREPATAPWTMATLPEVPLPPAPSSGLCSRTTLPRRSVPMTSDTEQLRALADRGAYAWMLQESDRMLRQAPGDATVHYYRALVLGHLDRQDEREHELRNAIYLDRRHALAHYELAQQLRARGDREGALRSLRNVQRLLTDRDQTERLHGEDITAGELAGLAEAQTRALQPEAER